MKIGLKEARENAKRTGLFDFSEDDIIWEIIAKYGLYHSEVREAILAYLYTFAHVNDEKDEVYKALNQGYVKYKLDIGFLRMSKFRKAFKI